MGLVAAGFGTEPLWPAAIGARGERGAAPGTGAPGDSLPFSRLRLAAMMTGTVQLAAGLVNQAGGSTSTPLPIRKTGSRRITFCRLCRLCRGKELYEDQVTS